MIGTKKLKQYRGGPVEQKLLLLLNAGLSLMSTGLVGKHFQIIKSASKEWNNINRRSLRAAVWRLYESKLINARDNADGTITFELSEDGERRVLTYSLDSMKIKKATQWDGFWRMVLFDIPHTQKKARDALAIKLRLLGFYHFQKSAFICPYECKNEIDFLVELFDVRRYTRYLLVKDVDTALELRSIFKLL